MGRIRTIKPEFWRNEELSALPEAAHMLAAALLNYADDEGYFNANERLIQADCFPLRDLSITIHGALNELSNIGYLRLGEGSDGRRYGQILAFRKHQVISRPSPSKISILSIAWGESFSTHGAIIEDSTPEGNWEGKGKDSSSSGSAREPAHDPPPDQAPITNVPDEAWALWRAVLKAAGVPEERLPTYWMPPAAVIHVQRWMGMGLTEQEIIDTARMTRANHTDPPNGPKALDHAMQRTAAAKIMPAFTPPDAQPLRMIGGSNGQRPGAAEKQEKLARIIRAAARGTT